MATVYVLEFDSAADSWTASGKWSVVTIRNSYEDCFNSVPLNLQKYVEEGREYYYRIRQWDSTTGEEKTETKNE